MKFAGFLFVVLGLVSLACGAKKQSNEKRGDTPQAEEFVEGKLNETCE